MVEKALRASVVRLTVHDFVKETGFSVDRFIIDRFWTSLDEDKPIGIDDKFIEWLGYDCASKRDNKAKFIKNLKSNNVSYTVLKTADPDLENYPGLKAESEKLPSGIKGKKEWILMAVDDFKEVAMCLQTKKARQIRRHYINLEKLFKLFQRYCIEYERRQREMVVEKLQKQMTALMNTTQRMNDKLDDLKGELAEVNEDNHAMARKLNVIVDAVVPAEIIAVVFIRT